MAIIRQERDDVVLAYLEDVEAHGQPGLQPVAMHDERRHGFAVPTMTASAFHAFVEEWLGCDPNGTWWPSGILVRVGDGALVYADGEGESYIWGSIGTTDGGERLYAVDGLCWTTAGEVAG